MRSCHPKNQFRWPKSIYKWKMPHQHNVILNDKKFKGSHETLSHLAPHGHRYFLRRAQAENFFLFPSASSSRDIYYVCLVASTCHKHSSSERAYSTGRIFVLIHPRKETKGGGEEESFSPKPFRHFCAQLIGSPGGHSDPSPPNLRGTASNPLPRI